MKGTERATGGGAERSIAGHAGASPWVQGHEWDEEAASAALPPDAANGCRLGGGGSARGDEACFFPASAAVVRNCRRNVFKSSVDAHSNMYFRSFAHWHAPAK